MPSANDWRERAACADSTIHMPFYDLDEWATESDNPDGLASRVSVLSAEWKRQVVAAQAVCWTCPEIAACLDYALRSNQRYGVWAAIDMGRIRSKSKAELRRQVIKVRAVIDGEDLITEPALF